MRKAATSTCEVTFQALHCDGVVSGIGHDEIVALPQIYGGWFHFHPFKQVGRVLGL